MFNIASRLSLREMHSGFRDVSGVRVAIQIRIENNPEEAKQLLLDASKKGVTRVKVLLDNGADKDVKDKDGATLLHWAAVEGHTEIVELLLDAGGHDVKATKYRMTPLFLRQWKATLPL